jgi:AAA domain
LLGPRQVGKTTLALGLAESVPSVYLDLENRLDLQKVRDIESFYADNSDKRIILDEVQRLPEIFTPLRGIIDQERRKGNKTGGFYFWVLHQCTSCSNPVNLWQVVLLILNCTLLMYWNFPCRMGIT